MSVEAETLVNKVLEFGGKGIRGSVTVEDSQFIKMKLELYFFIEAQGNYYGREEIVIEAESNGIKVTHEYVTGKASWTDDYFRKSYKNEFEDYAGNAEGPTAIEEEYIQSKEWEKKWLTEGLSMDDVKKFLTELVDYFHYELEDFFEDEDEDKPFDDGKQFARKALEVAMKRVENIEWRKLSDLPAQ